jgi:hypothetical protein
MTQAHTALIRTLLLWGTAGEPEANVLLDAGATNTVIVGNSTSLEDHGSGTVVIPMP